MFICHSFNINFWLNDAMYRSYGSLLIAINMSFTEQPTISLKDGQIALLNSTSNVPLQNNSDLSVYVTIILFIAIFSAVILLMVLEYFKRERIFYYQENHHDSSFGDN